MKPNTKYTKSGRINIAYQEFGNGPIDIVYIPGWVSNIDLMWACPSLVNFLIGLSKMGRVILFDKRGTGLSDRVIELSTIEERMDDIRAVMDAVGSERAVLFGHSEGGSVSALFAATYPDRVTALITFGVFARRRWSPSYPWAPTDEQRQEVYTMIQESWGSGDMDLASLAPSMATDTVFMDWLSSYFRSGASPSAALALTKMNTEVDIVDILDTISVPTLLMCRTHDIDVKAEESKYMSQHIKGSKYVEFDGDDHLFWVGNTDEVINEITTFIQDLRAPYDIESKLATILLTEMVEPKEIPPRLGERKGLNMQSHNHKIISDRIAQFRGAVVRQTEVGFLATFDGPSKAVHCGIAIKNALQSVDVDLRIGIHTGECTIAPDGQMAGIAVNVASEVQSAASSNEILITQTVKNLLSGSGVNFAEKEEIEIKGLSEPIAIIAVSDALDSEEGPEQNNIRPNGELAKETKPIINHSFLESILQCIETHMSDEAFGIDILCQEVGVSERQLQRKLKSIANKTPNQMVRSVRLHRAKEVLSIPEQTISEAAYQTGFSSLSYFAKCFKKEFGISPSDLLVH